MSWVADAAADADHGWGPAYGLFASAVSERTLRQGVEIGVAFGGHSASMLETAACISKLWSVDPYLHQPGYDDPINVTQARFDEMYSFAAARLAPFGDRSCLVRATSADAANIIKGDVDFVYIDAVHTAEAVWSDVLLWAPRIRLGGLIGGHDYEHPNFPGVTRAVDHLISQTNWPFAAAGEGVWWAERGPLDFGSLEPMPQAVETRSASRITRLCRRIRG